MCECVEICLCCLPCPPKSKCLCDLGEVRLDVTAPSTVIDLGADREFHKLPPGGEFTTNPAQLFGFGVGAAGARLQWTGDGPALVVVTADVSLERKAPTLDQHLVLKLNHGAGPGPLAAATLIDDSIQQTNLLSDDQDTAVSVSATVRMQPGDIVELWAAKEGPQSPTDPMNFTAQGFVLRAHAIRRLD